MRFLGSVSQGADMATQGDGTETGGIEIRTVRVRELEEFARESAGLRRPGEVVPTSTSRARAQARNPHADDDDVGLIVAYQDGRCIGYLGILPGLLRSGGRLGKVYWLSTWYVPPEKRSTGVGAMLLIRALMLHRDIAVTYFTEEATRVYQGLQFKPLGPLYYLATHLARFDVISLPGRALRRAVRRLGARSTPVLDRMIAATSRPAKTLLYAAMVTATREDRRRITTRHVDQIDEPTDVWEAGLDRLTPTRFYRDPGLINWMLADRWVVTNSGQATADYHFRDRHPLFDFVALEVYDRADGRRLGFAVLRVVDDMFGLRTVTVFDHHFSDPEDRRYLLALAVEQARSVLADRIVLPLACLARVKASRLLGRLFCLEQRAYFCRPSRPDSPLSRASDELTLDLADSDVAFA